MEDEFRGLFVARAAALRRTAFLLCGDWHQAEDLVSVSFAKLYAVWRRVDNPEPYLRQVLVRSWVDETRRPHRRERPYADLPDGPAGPGSSMTVADTARAGHSEEPSGWWADVDDGSHGPGRLGLWRSTSGLQQHPCSDSEFVAKAAGCTETMLDADTRLIVRTVSHTGAVNDIQVVIVHTDGSGVNVSDNNATWPAIPPTLSYTTPEQKRYYSHGTVGSPEPLYSADQLVAMAKALDAATG